jgi:kanamycin nucleotidyltransferase
MMNHEERINLAEEITELFLKKQGEDVLLGGIYGSTAKGTDTEYSDLEMFFIVRDESNSKTFNFAFKGTPVYVEVTKISEVERDITEVDIDWPLKMGRLFNLKVTCGDKTILKKFRKLMNEVSNDIFYKFIAKYTPLCYEGLGRLKAVKIRGNIHETGLFVAEVLIEFMLLTAIFNKEFINHAYLGGLPESFRFKYLPEDYEKTARMLMNWNTQNLDETITLADRFAENFVQFLVIKGIKIKEHTPLEEVTM